MKATALILVLGLVAAPIAVVQNTRCFMREDVIKDLGARYGEHPVKRGITAPGNLLEWFESRETGTFTVTITFPGGKTCVMAVGNSSEDLDPPIPGDEM